MKLLKNFQNKFKKKKKSHIEVEEKGKEKNPQNKFLNILALPNIKYSFDINQKYLIKNVINVNNNIPEKSKIKEILQTSLLNIYILEIQNYKILVPNNFFIRILIIPDGNCFYRSLSKFITGSEDWRLFFINCLYNYKKENKITLIDDNEYIDLKNTIKKIDDYIEKIKDEYFYTGKLEMLAAIKLFNIIIYIYELNNNSTDYKFIHRKQS